jgi:hypothetical protein
MQGWDFQNIPNGIGFLGELRELYEKGDDIR